MGEGEPASRVCVLGRAGVFHPTDFTVSRESVKVIPDDRLDDLWMFSPTIAYVVSLVTSGRLRADALYQTAKLRHEKFTD